VTAKEWAQAHTKWKQMNLLQNHSGEIVDFASLEDEVEQVITWAVDEERDACARIAESHNPTTAGSSIAEKIRAGSNSCHSVSFAAGMEYSSCADLQQRQPRPGPCYQQRPELYTINRRTKARLTAAIRAAGSDWRGLVRSQGVALMGWARPGISTECSRSIDEELL